ncbi:MAG TPA: hypothetical protein VMF35_06175 [Acidimicrobiales bacterium]|nr:hypothetical protein [Acidimicrobiales bacterium]
MSSPVSERPQFAYLVLSHKDAKDVETLADRILELSPCARIVVHHDARAGAAPWAGEPPAPIHLVERGEVSWGDWSMIEATLRLLRYGVERTDADWFVLLSGEHRPAVDLEAWEVTTVASGSDALLPARRLPGRVRFGTRAAEDNEYLARSRHRWSLVARPRQPAAQRAMGLLMKLSRHVRPVLSIEYVHRRDSWAVGRFRRAGVMKERAFYRGSQWFALNRRSATAALTVDPATKEWFTRSWIPDETYLQTALRGDPSLLIADTPTTFVLDTPEKPFPGWMQLSDADLPAVHASGLPFARKVDPINRPEVVARLDEAADRQRDALPTRKDGRPRTLK